MSNTTGAPPCPLCGGTEFAWGTPTAGGPQLQFAFRDKPFFEWKSSDEVLKARLCKGCGNILFFAASIAEE